MGKGKLMSQLGVDQETASDLLAGYHERVPFVKKLMNGHNERKAGEERFFIHDPRYEDVVLINGSQVMSGVQESLTT